MEHNDQEQISDNQTVIVFIVLAALAFTGEIWWDIIF